jgi:hypothetical protein
LVVGMNSSSCLDLRFPSAMEIGRFIPELVQLLNGLF